ncbi:copper resistance protein NlpE N-terminal domain-containing protein [Psychrobacter sp. AOP22-C1-22]|uniref:copper resistance protein NlpE N-terminal domain-containing protein n=1 Tax=unclassified Psychrobacter TaxID=196806 RepID=UPI001787982E|nr:MULTISPECIES: copper resistance protein NlpE N-terminal domain-containing protein [unclassified Psychrobacter]MBE0406696.1 copper resistance protein NlpE N-terminal domain-containing protein [Psychrobacter sp. FME6]MBE0444440.1 copper resistance protein NlpE N-terminal domain-containing protein [Psychrobacter sp. FME5]MDN5801027.1 copper resistance protein NlpE [Psychrobacter sp.]MDN5890741.1 copper resistance protein NlpE [Psychrobacter sp.]
MIYFPSTSSTTLTVISRCMRSLLAVPVCLLLASCDSASSSTNNEMTQSAAINSTQNAGVQNDEAAGLNNKAKDLADKTDNEEGQSLIAAANPNDNTHSAPMISASSSDSTLQATLMGDYGGMVPCASCDNIDITLNLFADGSVLKTSVFHNAEPAQPPLLESGVYRQDSDMITIVYEKKNIETYQIKDNHLVMMDEDKTPDNDYTLSRK